MSLNSLFCRPLSSTQEKSNPIQVTIRSFSSVGLNVTVLFADVDECISNSPCAHYCTNTAGSFKCSCRPGYKLNSDGKTCKGEAVASRHPR